MKLGSMSPWQSQWRLLVLIGTFALVAVAWVNLFIHHEFLKVVHAVKWSDQETNWHTKVEREATEEDRQEALDDLSDALRKVQRER